jgi:hypothetical protein
MACKNALAAQPKGLREFLRHELGRRIDADTYTTTGLGEADGRRHNGYSITRFGHGRSPRWQRVRGRLLAESEVSFGVRRRRMQKCKTRRRWASRVAIFDISESNYHFMGSPSITEYWNTDKTFKKCSLPLKPEYEHRSFDR